MMRRIQRLFRKATSLCAGATAWFLSLLLLGLAISYLLDASAGPGAVIALAVAILCVKTLVWATDFCSHAYRLK